MSSWTLLIGGVNVSQQLRGSASFTEIASSSSGQAALPLNGPIPSAVNGAAVLLLDAAGSVAWEGTISSTVAQINANGDTIATLATATVAASAAAIGTQASSSSDNDVAMLAQALCDEIGLPWGGPSAYGEIVGGLSFTTADDALTVLARLMGATWSVRNGTVVFRGVSDGVTPVPATFSLTPNPYSSIVLSGGVDQASRATLATTVATLAPDDAPTGYDSTPEIADQYTLGILAARMAATYATNQVGSATFALPSNAKSLAYGIGAYDESVYGDVPVTPATSVRAGDWLLDASGSVAVATSVTTRIANGTLQATVVLGAPALSQSPVYSGALSDTVQRYPAARVHDDYVISGGSVAAVISSAEYVARVQSTYNSADTNATPTWTLDSLPTPGNLLTIELLAFSSDTLALPGGWSPIDNAPDQSEGCAGVFTFCRTVQEGDAQTVTLTDLFDDGNPDYWVGRLTEFSGQDSSSPIDGHSYIIQDSSVASITLPSVTPNQSGDYALTFAAGGIGASVAPAIASPWVTDGTNDDDTSAYASQANLDLSPVVPQWTMASAQPASASLLLIAPQRSRPSPLTLGVQAVAAVIGSQAVTLKSASVDLPDNTTSLVVATPNGFAVTPATSAPLPGIAVPLAKVTTKNGSVTANVDVRTHGGIGNNNLKPPTPTTASPSAALLQPIGVSSGTLVAEGAALCRAHVLWTVSNVLFDDTIGSVEIVWSFAGQNQWNPGPVVKWSPNKSQSGGGTGLTYDVPGSSYDTGAFYDTGEAFFEAFVHGLGANQGYDLATIVRGRDGTPLTSAPMLLGTSPTISSEEIGIALNLDEISDGVTYARPLVTALTSGQVDLAKAGVIGKTLDNIVDGTSRGAVATTELAGTSGAYTVKQVNDGANTRTASNVASIVDENGNIPDTTAFKKYVPNALLSLLSDVALAYNAGSSGSTSIAVWLTSASGNSSNPNGSQYPAWVFPDGSGGIYPTAAACGSSGSPFANITGLNPSTTYYFVVFYSLITGAFTVDYYASKPTNAQLAVALADGQLIAVMAMATTSATVTTGGGTGGIHGGGARGVPLY